MLLSHHQNAGQNHDMKIANRYFENVAQFKYLEMTVTNQNLIQEEIKRRLNLANDGYHLVQNLFSLICCLKGQKLEYTKLILPTVLYGHETWSLTLR
jgi:hypothetical protein